jgi:CTP:molybdopterin cytidylyltransferase MocA
MRRLADGIRTQFVDDPAELALDVDTPDDLARARDRARNRGRALSDEAPTTD